MIKLSLGAPKIRFQEAYNDMSHFFNSEWVVSGGEEFLVTDEMYLKLLQFTDPSLRITTEKESALGGTIEDVLGSSYADRVKHAINLNPNKSLLWQFDALLPDMKTYVRHVALFAETEFYFMSPLDRLKKTSLRLICRILNKMRYFKVKREWDNWEKFLNEVHKKHD